MSADHTQETSVSTLRYCKQLTAQATLLACASLALLLASATLHAQALNPALQPVSGSQTKSYPALKKSKFVLGLSNISVVNTWRVQMIEEAKHEATQHAEIAQLVVTDAGGSASKQVADIEDLVARKVDALLVTAGSEDAVAGAVDKAYRAGIPVVIFSSDVNTQSYTTKILGDDAAFGKTGAEFLVKALQGKGKIVGVRGISGNSIDNDRWAGAMAVFQANPGIKVVATGFGNWAYDKGKQVCEALITAHPDLDGIWSSGGAMTQGCAEVLLENKLKLVPMTGEGNNGFLRIWQEMQLDSIAPQYPTWFGQQAVVAALRVLKGQSVAKDYLLRPPPITKDQVKSLYRADLNDAYWVGSSLPDAELKKIYSK